MKDEEKTQTDKSGPKATELNECMAQRVKKSEKE